MANSNQKGGHDDHADGIVEDRKQSPPVYFNILFYGLILWAIGFCGYYLFSGWSSAQEFQDKMSAHTAQYQPMAPQNPVSAAKVQAGKDLAAKVQAAAKPTAAAMESNRDIDPKALFAARCAGCHGADAKGGYGPDLTGDYKFGKTSDDIKASITNGREGKMPKFGGQLSEDEIEALANYLLKL